MGTCSPYSTGCMRPNAHSVVLMPRSAALQWGMRNDTELLGAMESATQRGGSL